MLVSRSHAHVPANRKKPKPNNRLPNLVPHSVCPIYRVPTHSRSLILTSPKVTIDRTAQFKCTKRHASNGTGLDAKGKGREREKPRTAERPPTANGEKEKKRNARDQTPFYDEVSSHLNPFVVCLRNLFPIIHLSPPQVLRGNRDFIDTERNQAQKPQHTRPSRALWHDYNPPER